MNNNLVNVDVLYLKRLDTQPEQLREGKLININEESGCNKKDEDFSEEAVPTKKTLKIFHNIESAKIKC